MLHRLILSASLALVATLWLFPSPARADEHGCTQLEIWRNGECQRIACGNGYREGVEECDDGPGNSDSQANACRTNCTRAHCGDGVTDNGEQCDKGDGRNSNLIPDRCRLQCKRPTCGDGVIDVQAGETCDFGAQGAQHGCYACRYCAPVKDNFTPNGGNYESIRLCPYQSWEVTDKAPEGVLRITQSNIVVDCGHTVIISKGRAGVQSIQQQTTGALKAPVTRSTKPTKTTRKPLVRKPKSSAPQGSSNPPSIPVGQTASLQAGSPAGTGILVTGNNVTIANCQIQNFRTAFDLRGNHITLVNNRICGNIRAIVSTGQGNIGNNNTCSGTVTGFTEGGQAKCTNTCD